VTRLPGPPIFFEREHPSAYTVLVRGERPVLVDPAFSSNLATAEQPLRQASAPPEDLHP
jgi:hypothetical protein